MGKANPEVSIPGAPVAPAADVTGAPAATPAIDPRDAEIAKLRAQLAQAQAANTMPSLVMEADGPNSKRYRAESKHLALTTEELDAQVRAGKVRLTDHHVLCKNGWYVNPGADREAREDLR